MLARRVGGRKLTIHTSKQQWQLYWHTKLHDELQRIDLPLKLDSADLLQRIGELFPDFGNGLLQLVKVSNDNNHYHEPFDMDVLHELLGVIATLNWYRQAHPGAVMIRLDEAFKDWQDWKKNSADYLACWLENGRMHIDVVTLHTQAKDSTLPALHEIREAFEEKSWAGSDVDNALRTARRLDHTATPIVTASSPLRHHICCGSPIPSPTIERDKTVMGGST